MKRPFLIDTDVASDDAVALIMALRSPKVRVVAITTVAGNVDVRQASRNALYTAELCGVDVPVFLGAEKPLTRAHVSADWFHGRDGLGDHGYPPPRRAPEQASAVEAIIRCAESHSGLEMVTLGPLTNVALAVQKKPEIVAKVSRCDDPVRAQARDAGDDRRDPGEDLRRRRRDREGEVHLGQDRREVASELVLIPQWTVCPLITSNRLAARLYHMVHDFTKE